MELASDYLKKAEATKALLGEPVVIAPGLSPSVGRVVVVVSLQEPLPQELLDRRYRFPMGVLPLSFRDGDAGIFCLVDVRLALQEVRGSDVMGNA
ncbi:MAG: hypothetical protein ABEL51_16515 [Salinibacter sp.]